VPSPEIRPGRTANSSAGFSDEVPRGVGGIGQNDLAADEPVEQHTHIRQILLDGRTGSLPAQLLDVRWMRYDLIALDEVGYVPLADVGAEFLFQVISDRAERAALIVTTNLPFSEWTSVFPNPRLCKALLDRITDRAHIIETGTESFRFKRTMEGRKRSESRRATS
jgi:hypothetical protein